VDLNKLASEVLAFIERSRDADCRSADEEFNALALAVFAAQYESVQIYRLLCDRRNIRPGAIKHWHQIPALPTAAFKEFEVSGIPPAERTAVFYSSGTTGQIRSKHFHHAQSLALYEASLLAWFERSVQPSMPMRFVFLTPEDAPNSSLVHMFKTVGRHFQNTNSTFTGKMNGDGTWDIDLPATVAALEGGDPVFVFGTAFSFVHLIDYITHGGKIRGFPPGFRVMETGGYKGLSREIPKPELHRLISKTFGITRSDIITEYGMSELSSQAYERDGIFHFPPWARAQVISPETGNEVADGETGLLRVFDLANIWSVMAVQTEDLTARRGSRFELLGRAKNAEPRGCSLMPDSKNGN
jgi:phenylacetate-coenzyme A ligase PaaK-like adenylate-forming protein